MKSEQGVAGLTILLSIVTMLFLIGLIIMIFSLMGGELVDVTIEATAGTITNETGAWLNATTYTVDESTARGFRDLTITSAFNDTDDTSIAVGNFTVSGSGFTNSSATVYADVSVSYTYTYDTGTTASGTINDTVSSIAGTTTWFPIIIVITAMVVLILLTVIIITAIRSSGLVATS